MLIRRLIKNRTTSGLRGRVSLTHRLPIALRPPHASKTKCQRTIGRSGVGASSGAQRESDVAKLVV